MMVEEAGSSGTWSEAFGRKQPHERSWTEAEPAQSLRMVAATGIGEADPIIDVGGGASHLVDRLLASGHIDVSVLDIAPAALAEARARIGDVARVTWIEADVLRWSPTRRYGLWHDRAVFHFLVDPDERATYVELAGRAVVPGGHLVLATFAPGGPEACSGLPVRRYAPEELAEAFAPAFRCVRQEAKAHVTPWGAVQPFTWVVLRRV